MQRKTLGVSHCQRRWRLCKSMFELKLFQLQSGVDGSLLPFSVHFLQWGNVDHWHKVDHSAKMFVVSTFLDIYCRMSFKLPCLLFVNSNSSKTTLGSRQLRMERRTFLAPDWTPACVPSSQRSDWWLEPCRLAWIKCLDIIHHHEADEPLQTTGCSFGRWWPFTCTVFPSAARLIKTHREKKNLGTCRPAHRRVLTIYVSFLKAMIKTKLNQSMPRRYFWAWKVALVAWAQQLLLHTGTVSQGERNSLASAMPRLDVGDLMHAGTHSMVSPAA